jgi:hypothetical protein
MSNADITYFVAITCGALGLAAFVWFIAVPAWNAYSKTWERIAAGFLSLYVLVALVLVGAIGGALIAYNWDRIAG